MTRETKIGLLVGMGVIILIGILISDHFSQVQKQQAARIASAPEIRADQIPQIPNQPRVANLTPRSTLPMPHEPKQLPPAVTRSSLVDRGNAVASAPDNSAAPVVSPEPAARTGFAPDRIAQDIRPAAGVDNRGGGNASPRTARTTPTGAGLPADQFATLNTRPQVIDGDVREADRLRGQSPESYPHPVPASNEREIAPAPRPVPTTTAAVLPAAPAAEPQIIHNVKEGETLYSIAKKYYGDGNMTAPILEANKKSIPSANRMRSGVRLVIPAKPGTPSAAPAAASAPAAPVNAAPAASAPVVISNRPAAPTSAAANTPAAVTGPAAAAPANASAAVATVDYTVKEGDTLAGLSRQFMGTRNWQKLYELNKDRIKNPDRMAPGTVIRVPKKNAA